jgi:Ca-activated chloride channel family protein
LALEFGDVTTVMNYPNVLPDLYKGSQLLLVGRYRGSGKQNAQLLGMLNKAKKRYAFNAIFPEESDKNAFLPRLWARRRISYLLSQMRMYGEAQEARAEVIRLAKRYHIATRYTSMVSTAPRRIASLSPARIKPGDPEIRIRAPRDAKEVTAVFPFGVTKSARYEAALDLWTVRFLIPRDTADGSYWVRLLVTTKAGKLKSYRVAYTVDTAAPTVKLSVDGPIIPGATITLSAQQVITEAELRQSPVYRRNPERTRRLFAQMMADTRQVEIRLPSGKLLSLTQEKPGLWTTRWRVPLDIGLGSQTLKIIATDVAGNRSSADEAIAVTR